MRTGTPRLLDSGTVCRERVSFLKSDLPLTWLQPQWLAPASVRAVMTDRHGGVSLAPYNSMNLGDHVGDEPIHVRANRACLQNTLGRRPVFLQQVHGVQSAMLDADTPDGIQADACMAATPDIACTIMLADCLPVLLCDTAGRWVAAAHAGWRGLAGQAGRGVLETLVASDPVNQSQGTDILAWLGPCIGPEAFEVGPDVRAAFCDSDAQAVDFFRPSGRGKFLADLAGLARQRLLRLGISRIFGNDGQAPWCTVTQASRFFSHRRDGRVFGQSGRMAACIWLER
jgi:polyphenol oxidase